MWSRLNRHLNVRLSEPVRLYTSHLAELTVVGMWDARASGAAERKVPVLEKSFIAFGVRPSASAKRSRVGRACSQHRVHNGDAVSETAWGSGKVKYLGVPHFAFEC
jgi:hypothetical protein